MTSDFVNLRACHVIVDVDLVVLVVSMGIRLRCLSCDLVWVYVAVVWSALRVFFQCACEGVCVYACVYVYVYVLLCHCQANTLKVANNMIHRPSLTLQTSQTLLTEHRCSGSYSQQCAQRSALWVLLPAMPCGRALRVRTCKT